MNSKKTYALVLSGLIFLGITSAVKVEAEAGKTTVLNQSFNNTTTTQFSGNLQLLNPQVKNQSLQITPDYKISPGQYNGTASYNNTTIQYNVKILPTVDWNLTQKNLSKNLSLSSSGRIEDIKLNVSTNINPSFKASLEGNITDFLSFNFLRLENPGQYTAVLDYGIASDQQKGFYNGTLTVNNTDLGETRNTTLSFNLEDKIKPEIESLDVDNIMATTDQDFSVTVSDNLNVSNVTGKVLRTVKVERENKTVNKNLTVVKSAVFKREDDNTDLWSYTFSNTSEIGQYYLKLEVEDSSGNRNNRTVGFKVEGLDAVKVLDNNFELESVKPTTESNSETKAVKDFMRLDESTEVTVSLDSLTHSVGNSTLEENIGVLKPGDSVAEKFSENNGEVSVSEPGVYSLVVSSNTKESYNGVLKVGTVPQHVEINDTVRFEGNIIDPVYPVPTNFSIGGFTGRVEFQDNSSAVKDAIIFTGRLDDASRCRGVDSWNQCLSSLDLGELKEVKNKMEKVSAENNSLRFQKNLVVLLFVVILGGYFGIQKLEDQIVMRPYKV